MSSTRNPSGKCPPSTFDDGYTCLSPEITFPNKKNLVDKYYFSNNNSVGVIRSSSVSKCGSTADWKNDNYKIDNSILSINPLTD